MKKLPDVVYLTVTAVPQYRSKNYASAVFTSWLGHQAWENLLPAILFCFHMCDVCCVAFESPIGGIKLLSQALE